jgi:hypothetical protein
VHEAVDCCKETLRTSRSDKQRRWGLSLVMNDAKRRSNLVRISSVITTKHNFGRANIQTSFLVEILLWEIILRSLLANDGRL